MTAPGDCAMIRVVPMNRSHILVAALCFLLSVSGRGEDRKGATAVIKEYCYDCHDSAMQEADLDLEALLGGRHGSAFGHLGKGGAKNDRPWSFSTTFFVANRAA